MTSYVPPCLIFYGKELLVSPLNSVLHCSKSQKGAGARHGVVQHFLSCSNSSRKSLRAKNNPFFLFLNRLMGIEAVCAQDNSIMLERSMRMMGGTPWKGSGNVLCKQICDKCRCKKSAWHCLCLLIWCIHIHNYLIEKSFKVCPFW